MTIKTVKHITTYYESNREFYILRDEQDNFWAIEDKFVNEDGSMKQEINGITGLRSNTAAEAIQKAHDRVIFQNLLAQGMTKEEALTKMFEEEEK